MLVQPGIITPHVFRNPSIFLEFSQLSHVHQLFPEHISRTVESKQTSQVRHRRCVFNFTHAPTYLQTLSGIFKHRKWVSQSAHPFKTALMDEIPKWEIRCTDGWHHIATPTPARVKAWLRKAGRHQALCSRWAATQRVAQRTWQHTAGTCAGSLLELFEGDLGVTQCVKVCLCRAFVCPGSLSWRSAGILSAFCFQHQQSIKSAMPAPFQGGILLLYCSVAGGASSPHVSASIGV